MTQERKNEKIIYLMKILKRLLGIFTETFLSLYLFDLSDGKIFPIAIFYLIAYASVVFFFYLFRKMLKKINKMIPIRIGIIFTALFFILLMVLKEKVIDFVWLIALAYGIGESFYYSVYNSVESKMISDKKLMKFLGHSELIPSLIQIVFTLSLAGLLTEVASGYVFIILVAIAAANIVLTYFLSYEVENKNEKFYDDIVLSGNEKFKYNKVFVSNILNGFNFTGSSFNTLTSLFVIFLYGSNLSLGIYSVLAIIASLLVGYVLGFFIKAKNYDETVFVFNSMFIVSIILLIIKLNVVTLVIYTLTRSISNKVTSNIVTNARQIVSNLPTIEKKYKMEFSLGMEWALFIGRGLSYGILIVVAFFYSQTTLTIVLIIYIIALVIQMIDIKKMINNKKLTKETEVLQEKKTS